MPAEWQSELEPTISECYTAVYEAYSPILWCFLHYIIRFDLPTRIVVNHASHIRAHVKPYNHINLQRSLHSFKMYL